MPPPCSQLQGLRIPSANPARLASSPMCHLFLTSVTHGPGTGLIPCVSCPRWGMGPASILSCHLPFRPCSQCQRSGTCGASSATSQPTRWAPFSLLLPPLSVMTDTVDLSALVISLFLGCVVCVCVWGGLLLSFCPPVTLSTFPGLSSPSMAPATIFLGWFPINMPWICVRAVTSNGRGHTPCR